MRIFKWGLILTILLAITSYAGVNLKNGNFYISYTDIVVPGGGNKLEVTRTYNSKSTNLGWFGFGWGSDFETYLEVAADGSVVVHENGSGAETRFIPKTPVDASAAAKKIIEAMKMKTGLNDKVAAELQKKLEGDAELRNLYGNKFNVTSSIADGTILYSNDRGLQELHKINTGYKRIYNDGKTEFFSSTGRLAEIKDKNGYTITLTYDGKNLKSIKDSQAKQLFFDWYPDGKIKSTWSGGDKKASYKYKGNDMVESKDVAGNSYTYDYDNNHNLTAIGYSDKTKMLIKYENKTQFVTTITDRNGKDTKYEYGSDVKNPDLHYWTSVTKEDFTGKPVTNRYEYEIRVRPDGSQYTYRIYTVINDVKTETIYNECCSLPLKIARGNQVTTFEYNDKGLLTKKSSTKGEFVNLEYHQDFNKITRVVNNEGWTKFEYDKKGNLYKAINSVGKAVLLIYDRNGRITKMVDDDKDGNKRRVLSFDYNAMGKPVKIVMEKVGEILVDYDNYGEIKKVESKAGHKMALQVTQAFQNLLSIVKPAGVNLSL